MAATLFWEPSAALMHSPTPKDEVDTTRAREPLSGGTCFSGVPATGVQELCAPVNDPDATMAPRSVPAHFGARHAVEWLELRVIVCPGNP